MAAWQFEAAILKQGSRLSSRPWHRAARCSKRQYVETAEINLEMVRRMRCEHEAKERRENGERPRTLGAKWLVSAITAPALEFAETISKVSEIGFGLLVDEQEVGVTEAAT